MNAVIADQDTTERVGLVELFQTDGGFQDDVVQRSGLHADNSNVLTVGAEDRLVGERAGRIYFIAPRQVDYIEADGNYVRIHVGADRFINRDSVTRLAKLLQEVGFLRINRAILLNLQRVAFAEREGSGVLAFMLHSGARVVSSAGMRLEPGALLRIARTQGSRSKKHGR